MAAPHLALPALPSGWGQQGTLPQSDKSMKGRRRVKPPQDPAWNAPVLVVASWVPGVTPHGLTQLTSSHCPHGTSRGGLPD